MLDVNNRCVLVVEDEEMLLEILVSELEEKGFSVIPVMTAEDAISVLEGCDQVDLLFTDIKLPGAMNGFRLAECAQTLRVGMPVIYATGFTDEQPVGIDSSRFFLKPYSIAAVIDKAWSLIAITDPYSRR